MCVELLKVIHKKWWGCTHGNGVNPSIIRSSTKKSGSIRSTSTKWTYTPPHTHTHTRCNTSGFDFSFRSPFFTPTNTLVPTKRARERERAAAFLKKVEFTFGIGDHWWPDQIGERKREREAHSHPHARSADVHELCSVDSLGHRMRKKKKLQEAKPLGWWVGSRIDQSRSCICDHKESEEREESSSKSISEVNIRNTERGREHRNTALVIAVVVICNPHSQWSARCVGGKGRKKKKKNIRVKATKERSLWSIIGLAAVVLAEEPTCVGRGAKLYLVYPCCLICCSPSKWCRHKYNFSLSLSSLVKFVGITAPALRDWSKLM